MQTGALAPGNATPGRTLAAARTERGMSVSEVAQRLKFSLRHIDALESDRYDALPGGPYVRGMIRTYAKLLGVDAAPLLETLPRPSAAGEPAMQPRDMSVPFPQGPRSSSRVYLLLSMLIIVAVTVVLAEWLIRSQRDAPQEAALASATGEPVRKADPLPDPVSSTGDARAKSPQPAMDGTAPHPAQDQAFVAPASGAVASAPPATTGPALATPSPVAGRAVPIQSNQAAPEQRPAASAGAPPPGRARLAFTFELESWVEIRDAAGDVIVSTVNPAGSAREVVGTAPFTLVIGNASGVRLTFNGQPVNLVPHRASDVARVTLE